ncbi:MAG: RecQ family ATP-dependent DNA helicase [Aerococcus sp.]|nr:RecQ family ATP-dependent DNA helicase [Aerococcus sp.]
MDDQAKLEALYGPNAQFKPGQQEALSALKAGHHAIALLPTGGGKSLIYQLFQYQSTGLTVIVSPLVALMQDQVAQLQRLGIKRAVALNSTLNHSEQQQVLQQLGQYQFLFLSPEMIDRPQIIGILKQQEIHLLVIDEAHCISQWGFDFRVEYSELIQVRRKLNQPLTLALTATATEKALQDIQKFLFYPFETVETVKVSLDRPNIFYATKQVNEANKIYTLTHDLVTLPKPGIVYVHNKAEADQLEHLLTQETTLKVASYHADYSPEDRYSIQQQFQSGQLEVILATSAFGMGINQGDIRFVIHYHLPLTLADLIQEIGRSGRDGAQACGMTYYNPEELARLNYFKIGQYWPVEEFYPLLMQVFDTSLTAIATQLELAESVLSLLAFYQRHFSSATQAIAHYRHFLQIKQKEVTQVQAYCQTNECLRQHLLRAFDETLTNRSKFCCQNDQPDYQTTAEWTAYLASGRRKPQIPSYKLTPWQDRLGALLG